MEESVKPDPQETQTQDAELVAKNFQEDEEKNLEVDFEDEYQKAQKMSHGLDDKDDQTNAQNLKP